MTRRFDYIELSFYGYTYRIVHSGGEVTFDLPGSVISVLNVYGENGWEVVRFRQTFSSDIYLMMRER